MSFSGLNPYHACHICMNLSIFQFGKIHQLFMGVLIELLTERRVVQTMISLQGCAGWSISALVTKAESVSFSKVEVNQKTCIILRFIVTMPQVISLMPNKNCLYICLTVSVSFLCFFITILHVKDLSVFLQF